MLSAKWGKLRGIEIVSFGVSSVKASEKDEQMLKEMQRNAAFMDPTRTAAHFVGAQASAMQTAAGNQGAGPAMTLQFMGVPVDGSTKMPNGHMDAIEPYDYCAFQPFSTAYLPGYMADKYTRTPTPARPAPTAGCRIRSAASFRPAPCRRLPKCRW